MIKNIDIRSCNISKIKKVNMMMSLSIAISWGKGGPVLQ